MTLTRTVTHGLAALVLALSLGGLNLTRRAQAGGPFTVNLNSDGPDANPGDGVCETATGGGLCTLRAAVQEANALAGADTVNLPAGTYLLTQAGAGEDAALTGDLDITGTLTLTGAGQATTIVDGNGLDRVFQILAGSTVTLSGVTIQNGNSGSANGGGLYNSGTLTLIGSTISGNTTTSGGGLYNSGTLTLIGSTISGNTATGFGGGLTNYGGNVTLTGSTVGSNRGVSGGGLFNTGALTLTSSSISTNAATGDQGSSGGGLFSDFGGNVTLTSSTVSSNSAYYTGGGLYNGSTLTLIGSTVTSNYVVGDSGGLSNRRNATLTGSTVSGNLAGYGGGLSNSSTLTVTNSTVSSNSAGDGAGVWNCCGPLTLSNSTVSSNIASYSGGGLFASSGGTATATDSLLAGNSTDCSGTLTSQGYNLIQNTTGCTVTGILTGVISGTDPLLGPLQTNGGPTLTQALPAGSPAIGAGDPAGCKDNGGTSLSADQRGAPRVGRCDIGAYEAGLAASKIVSGTFRAGGLVTYTVSLSNAGGAQDLTGVVVTDSLPAQVAYLPNSFSVNNGSGGVNGNVISWSGTVFSNTATVITFGATISDTARTVVITNMALSSWGGVTMPASASLDTTVARVYLPVVAGN